MVFSQDQTLSVIENELKSLNIYYSNGRNKIVLMNPNNIEVKKIEIYNILGQSVSTISDIIPGSYSEYEVANLSDGSYIIKLYTDSHAISKKVLMD